MKKIVIISVIALLAFSVFSCKSTDPAAQEAINNAFEKIYDQYRDGIIMDGAKPYTVVKGNTLAKIAKAQYGSDNMYFFPLIMLASPDAGVADPDLITPGMKLNIPDLEKNLKDAKAKANIKSFINEVAGVYDKKEETTSARKLRALAETL